MRLLKERSTWRWTMGAAAIALIPGTAFAQAQSATDNSGTPPVLTPNQTAASDVSAEEATSEPIVVTGTLIRGIAPAGNNVIGVTEQQIAASGATSTAQILNSIPQVGNAFNALPAGVSPQAGANASNPINRPNLRNLPGANTSGGAQTLVLIDGHRVVGAGIQQIAVDPDILAPGVIGRVEALTDGGSAVYGSDAIGGVLNFITRDRFDGLQTTARYGFGDDFKSVDASVIAGKDWGTGGLYVAYGYSHHDSIYGRDRDWVKQINWDTGVPTGRNCASPNVTVGTTSYVTAGGGIAPGGPVTCDFSDPTAIYPESTLHNVFARLTQDLSDSVHFNVTALYANRAIRATGGALGTGGLATGAAGTARLCPTTLVVAGCIRSANYRSPVGAQAGQPETVTFDYTPLYGVGSTTQRTDLETWSVAPELSVELGSGWQVRALFSYGSAETSYRNAQISASAQAAALNAGTLNPFDVGATTPAVAATLLRYDQGIGRNELYDYRAIADGPLFSLPGGAVRAALGYEHMEDNFRRRTTNATTYLLQNPTTYSQKVDSVFGELQVPLVSSDNAASFLSALTLSASARYDKYNDFGDTFNPKMGVTAKPVDWITLRGNWGKSFNAPTPVDNLGVLASAVATVPAAFLRTPAGVTAGPGEIGLFVSGTSPDIAPQKATNWSIGAEIEPPFIDGLTLSASYYNIDLKGTIGRPVTGADLTDYYANFPQLYSVRPSGQQLAAYIAQFNPANFNFTVANPNSTAQALINAGGTTSPVLVTLDTRSRNLGRTKLDGIDFAANYVLDAPFGSFDATVSGNYRISQKTRTTPTSLISNDLAINTPRFRIQGTLGTTLGGFRGQVTWNHTAGYRRGTPEFGQDRIKPFDSFNLYLSYDVSSESKLLKDVSFSVNVQNILDKDTPEFRSASTPGYDTSLGTAFSIGRVVQVGVSKKF
jgi:iron complex outermembrane receptor protein